MFNISIDLSTLPIDHPLRNAPLAEIGAQTKGKGITLWKTVESHWKISKKCYNDLNKDWTDYADWQVDQVSS